MEKEGIDALLVCGNQYAGFEGAVLYMSGFEIVHRYVYVLFPLEGDPTLVFPREARWIGEKGSRGGKNPFGLTARGKGIATRRLSADGSAWAYTVWIS